MSPEGIVSRIQKLLALSNSPNENEAKAAAAKAHEMLAEHNLSLSEVEQEDNNHDGTIGHMTAVSKHSSPWVRHLWGAVARLYFCDYMYSCSNHKTKHWVIGTDVNSKIACSMADYLQTTITRLANVHSRGQDSRFKTGFKKGCSARLRTRLREMRQEAKTPKKGSLNPNNLPALYEQTEKALKAYMEDTWGETRSTKSRERSSDYNGYHAGRTAADGIGLNPQVGGTSNKRLA